MIKTLLFIIYYYKTCLKGKLQNKSFHIKNFFFTYKLQLFFLSPLYSFVSNPDLFLRFIFYSFLLLTDFFHCQKLKPDPCALQREDSMLPVGSLSLLSTQQNLESAGRRACIQGLSWPCELWEGDPELHITVEVTWALARCHGSLLVVTDASQQRLHHTLEL